MDNVKPKSTPGDSSFKNDQIDNSHPMQLSTQYQSAVGSLLWFAIATRPDIMYATTVCAQYQSKPTKRAWSLVKRIFQYLKGTTKIPLVINPTNLNVEAYSDSNHGDTALNRSAITGGMITIYWINANIMDISKTKNTIDIDC
jgi:hypothetical protein